MSFQQYPNISPDVIAKLQKHWLGPACYYLFKDSSGSILRGVLFEIDEENYNKAGKRLTGDTEEIVKGDKVYILPNCRIPLFKLEDYIKLQDAIITREITEATKIIGHDKVIEVVQSQAQGSVMLMNMTWTLSLDKFTIRPWYNPKDKEEAIEYENAQTNSLNQIMDNAEDQCNINATGTIFSSACLNNTSISNYHFDEKWRKRFITPAGVLVLYYSILNKIPIINESLIFEKIGKPVALDEESYKSILDMLSSKDENDHKVGAEILANCDIEKSMFYIWKLSQEKRWAVSGLSRFKNIRLFIRMSRWDHLAGLNEEEAIEYLYEKNLLTKESFSELFPAVAKEYSDKLESPVCQIVIKPSEKYSDFANGQEVVYTKESSVTDPEVEDDYEETEE